MEVAAVCLDRVRVMQRPRLTKTGGATAAAEFELVQRNSDARRKKGGGKARRAGLFIRASS